MKTVP